MTSLIRYQNQYPKIWIIPKIEFHEKMIPKNPGISQKDKNKKSESTPKTYPNNGTSPYHDMWKLTPLGFTIVDNFHYVKTK